MWSKKPFPVICCKSAERVMSAFPTWEEQRKIRAAEENRDHDQSDET